MWCCTFPIRVKNSGSAFIIAFICFVNCGRSLIVISFSSTNSFTYLKTLAELEKSSSIRFETEGYPLNVKYKGPCSIAKPKKLVMSVFCAISYLFNTLLTSSIKSLLEYLSSREKSQDEISVHKNSLPCFSISSNALKNFSVISFEIIAIY